MNQRKSSTRRKKSNRVHSPDPKKIQREIKSYLEQAIDEFAKAAHGASRDTRKWLRDTFRDWFTDALGDKPGRVWKVQRNFVLRHSKGMGHYAMAIADSHDRKAPNLDDLNESLAFIKNVNCGNRGKRGKFCGN